MGIVKYEDDPEMKEYQKSYIELIARKVGDEIYQKLEKKHYDPNWHSGSRQYN